MRNLHLVLHPCGTSNCHLVEITHRGTWFLQNNFLDLRRAIMKICSFLHSGLFGNLFTIDLVQVTIAPRAGRELGYVRMKMNPIKFNEGMLT